VDDTAPSRSNVLRQSGKATFPWCVSEDVGDADGSVEMKFKPISGKEGQAGGVVWRQRWKQLLCRPRQRARRKRFSLLDDEWIPEDDCLWRRTGLA
jgi:hypothetical protein